MSVSTRLSAEAALALAEKGRLSELMEAAARLRDDGHGNVISYSRKIFIPLTHLCRDSCHYCTFAKPPRGSGKSYMSFEEIDAVLARGEATGCTEVLFTLGDKPELRYPAARRELEGLGHATTLDYLKAAAQRALTVSTCLPHLNPGVMTHDDLVMLRPVSASMGLMLETASTRLSARGGPHFGSPDKDPPVRLETMRLAGELAVPFTSGLLVGIGETRRERVESLLALRDLDDRHGHIQEIIIQPFRAKAGTRMSNWPDASDEDLLWTIAVARLIFGAAANIQTPPNLAPKLISKAVAAGINDWGGISPVTADFVNPEAPWPHIDLLERQMAEEGRTLVQRLPLYPSYAGALERWVDPAVRPSVIRSTDSEGWARGDNWSPGGEDPIPVFPAPALKPHGGSLSRALASARTGAELAIEDIAALFSARGTAFHDVCATADEIRRHAVGDTVRYVVNRNINYTNVCSYRCTFCAFSKGKAARHLRGHAYDLDAAEIERRVSEAWARGATEVCMQGGIHPAYTGDTYLAVLRAVKRAAPDMHVHAFSPLEIDHGAETLGVSIPDFLSLLRKTGLGSLPGTAAEILDDEVRAHICPDKLDTARWLRIVQAAHEAGLRTTATIMFGHIDKPVHWARHLLAIRRLQARTGGFTEFVPLPFVHMEAPIYFKGRARKGPTWRETVLMHAVARLALHPVIPNIQTSWVKLGAAGAAACLNAGANDLGGTLMNESISRAAGALHGQELPPAAMDELIRSIGRQPEQRTTLYRPAPSVRRDVSYMASPLAPVAQTPARRTAQLVNAVEAPTF